MDGSLPTPDQALAVIGGAFANGRTKSIHRTLGCTETADMRGDSTPMLARIATTTARAGNGVVAAQQELMQVQ